MKSYKNLREQINDICRRHINSAYASHVSFPTQLTQLAAMAFIERWSEENSDSRAVRKACEVMQSDGFVSSDVPFIE